ncbi:hypothetical protein HM1_0790 [Heliomicrobium modesticaldum Ice1]|uniref:Uncharacterized protein n=1 Tax=Heliobacterium modesticaldum (strain ATCC 51547 / Ice1) TaxID=498761 RepID=B0TB38_HELMI|nr:hypothetical protein [Heliomicrobium modesticaldum]ABZ83765.1 hypothetical protein HM1_0790 [Heliomicrobium modesticaldum Ice1]
MIEAYREAYCKEEKTVDFDPSTMSVAKLLDLGYRFVDQQNAFEGCRAWWWAWTKLRPLIVEKGIDDIDAVDKVVKSPDYMSNWCQDFDDHLINEAQKRWIFAIMRIAYAQDFVRLLPKSDLLIIQNMRLAVAESYAILGQFDKSETEFRQLIKDYPQWTWGYVGWGDLYSYNKPDDREVDVQRAREIFAAGLDAGVDEPEYLEQRIRDLDAFVSSEKKHRIATPVLKTSNKSGKKWRQWYRQLPLDQQVEVMIAAIQQSDPCLWGDESDYGLDDLWDEKLDDLWDEETDDLWAEEADDLFANGEEMSAGGEKADVMKNIEQAGEKPEEDDLADDQDAWIIAMSESPALSEQLEETLDELYQEKRFALIARLVAAHRDHVGRGNRQVFCYCAEELAYYYLYRREWDELRIPLRWLVDAPEHNINQILPVLSTLVASGETALAVSFATSVRQSILETEGLMWGVDDDIVAVLRARRLEQTYDQLQGGQGPDWKALVADLAQVGCKTTPNSLAMLKAGLTDDVSGDVLREGLCSSLVGGLESLSYGFYRFMRQKKNMDFTCADLIWRRFVFFMTCYVQKKKATDKLRFRFTKKKLESALMDWLGLNSMGLSNKKPDSVVLLWGLPYVYDYLKTTGLIDEDCWQKTVDLVAVVKDEILYVLDGELWKYAFVLQWTPADAVGETPWLEKECFGYCLRDIRSRQ